MTEMSPVKPIRVRAILSLIVIAALAVCAEPALAKNSSGSSIGSRGSKTFAPVAPPATPTAPSGSFLQHGSSSGSGSAAQPITRSVTPPPALAAPTGPAMQSEALAPMAVPRQQGIPTAPIGMNGQPLPTARTSFMSGLAGGLIGAGIGSMLFGGGHGFFGEGTGGFLGALIQLGLLFFVGRWLLRTFFGSRPAPRPTAYGRSDFGFREPGFDEPSLTARGPGGPRLDPVMVAAPVAAPVAALANPRQFVLNEQDLGAIEALLVQTQAAWTSADVATLQRLATPEMAGYFNEQLQNDRARGLENRVEQVQLLKGDVNETWKEGPLDYATVTLTWSAVDYTLRLPSGEVVAGDPGHSSESVEVWTLLRSPGAPWILSAIQQV